MVLKGMKNAKGKAFSPYPPGFPVVLGLAHKVSGLSFPLVVVFFHCLLVFAIFYLGSGFISWPALLVVFFSDTAFELAGNVWSEFSFIFLLIMSVLWFNSNSKSGVRAPLFRGILAGLILTGAFFMRYVAVFIIPWLLWNWIKVSKEQRPIYATAVAIFLASTVGWFFIQYFETGLLTGGDRYANGESNAYLTIDLARGMVNQLLVLRDWQGTKPFWELAGAIIQFFLLAFFLSFKGRWLKVFQHPFFMLGLCYLFLVIPVRWYFYFAEGFDFRLMGPGFLFLGLGIIDGFLTPKGDKRRAGFILFWLAASLIFHLPKGPLLSGLGTGWTIIPHWQCLFLT